MTQGLTEEEIKKIRQILSEVDKIDEAIIFGSRAKGNAKNGSDIDLVLKGVNLNHGDRLSLLDKLDDSDLPYKFDVLIYNDIKDMDVLQHIERVGKSFYKKSLFKKESIRKFIGATNTKR